MSEGTSLKFIQTVKAPVEDVFRAFTNATTLTEWLCDFASFDARPGGRVYFWWHSGHFVAGEVTKVEPNKSLSYVCQGRREPGLTEVFISFAEKPDGIRVTLEHGGMGNGHDWAHATKEIQHGWETGLKNLASSLETGLDLRVVTRPMLGINFSDFSEEIAKELGIPVSKGIRLSSTLEGMGAYAAGLRNGDVIIEFAGKPVSDFNTLVGALHGHKAGDHVKVVFYRGTEKQVVDMELSRRPIPDIPTTGAGLAEAARKYYANSNVVLDGVLQGVTDAEADFKPGPHEWSIKEVLAHLIQGERFNHTNFNDLEFAQERVSDAFGENSHAWTKATVTAYPTLALLVEELKRLQVETAAYMENFPEKFLNRKASIRRLFTGYTQPDTHVAEHKAQIEACLAAARKK